MYELTDGNAVEWLRQAGHLSPTEPARAEWLTWGVSNVVLRVNRETAADLVIKQSRERLRTEVEWISRLDRVWREAELMRHVGQRLPAGCVPAVLFEDRENYLFAMEALPAEHTVWKAELLAGTADPRIAALAGKLLSGIHQSTWQDSTARERWGDREVFEQLRTTPFYRYVAGVHPQLTESVNRLIDSMAAHAECVVHADFSPKNLLILDAVGTAAPGNAARGARRLALVDWETGHYGDPAFDLGFFLSHLLLKAVLHAPGHQAVLALVERFLQEYAAGRENSQEELFARSVPHLAGCMLARIDGTSTIDYLPQPGQQDIVRRYSCELFLNPPRSLVAAITRLSELLGDIEEWPADDTDR